MSTCLPSQLTAPAEPAAPPRCSRCRLPLRLGASGSAGRHGETPGAQPHRGAGQHGLIPGPEEGLAAVRPPSHSPPGSGPTSHACGNAPACAKQKLEMRGCTFPRTTSLPARCSSRRPSGSAAGHRRCGTQPSGRVPAACGTSCCPPAPHVCPAAADQRPPPRLPGTLGTAAAGRCPGDCCQNGPGPREVISN